MRKILTSLLVVTAVVAVVAVGTWAIFSDTEVSTGNAFTTGTVDIEVNGEDSWETVGGYVMNDMKPSYTDYIEFRVKNVGNNPVNLWKTLEKFDTYDVGKTNSEDKVEDGTEVDNIDDWINYDMRVELYPDDATTDPVWWETIYMDSDNKKIGDLEDTEMYLGMIPVGWTMKVTQSYHMVTETGNEYQADGMTFDIKLYAEQLTNTITLENKEVVQYMGYSHTILNDNKYAVLTYKVMDDEFGYDLDVYGMPDGEYTLIKYDDPLDGSNPWPAPNSLALANVTVSGGAGSTTGSIDLNQDMINAKLWLVKATYTPGLTTGALNWSPTTTLFETGLVDYYDSL